MIKSYSEVYPAMDMPKWDFQRSILAMLNCRRHLEKEGFCEKRGGLAPYMTYIGIGAELPDGRFIDEHGFHCATSVDSQLEVMLSQEKINLVYDDDRAEWGYKPSTKKITTGLKGNNFEFIFSIIEYHKKKSFLRAFLEYANYEPDYNNPERFSFGYQINLEKEIITSPDLEKFESYKSNLSRIVLINDLTEKSSPETSKIQPQELNYKPLPDPWSIKTPEIKSIIGER